ncbi:hypothetical protein Daura_33205 [Dactylosporangium aurantiacum]|uniref:Uncharacterized protein n=1 Tax=Dactylosporangium aurantiacum TaxID=35754 RepID=A0A9Q9IE81_9ACTN|nr:hypothetical protein [Dactylosporangium aurantiacum]MDG6105052.1 hypothetical protein [Dactylosporangium aurantiacum]UWZ51583.1 hypothetical protein Daura_33205 [Dactylosporangium aurantiacum]
MAGPGSHLEGGFGHAHLPEGTAPDITAFKAPVPDVARAAMDAKAAALGDAFTGPPDGQPWVPIGAAGDPTFYARKYARCTIFYQDGIGAYEIHGGIRDKYERLNGYYRFGPPLTDERPCPDGRGRYNHFWRQASIYWHPETGPYAVQGAIRNLWATRGWERGPLGYPVSDQVAFGEDPPGCLFQNGALAVSDETGAAGDAPSVRLDRETLLRLVWMMFNTRGHAPSGQATVGQVILEAFDPLHLIPLGHAGNHSVGLYPQRSLDSVGPYSGEFLRADNRVVAFTINGFHDAGPVLPDQTWTVHIQLRFQDEASTSDQPGTNLVATHVGNRVRADGIGAGTLAEELRARLAGAFPVRLTNPGNPAEPDLVPEAQFLGLIIEADGALSLHFCNTAAGRLAQLFAQRKVDALIGG